MFAPVDGERHRQPRETSGWVYRVNAERRSEAAADLVATLPGLAYRRELLSLEEGGVTDADVTPPPP